MGGSTLLRSLLWSLFALSSVAHAQGSRRALYFRQDNNGTTSTSASAASSSGSVSVSSSIASSSSSSRSSSIPISSSSSSSPSPSPSSSSPPSTTSSTSSTSTTTTLSRSSSVSSASFSSSAPVSSVSAKTSVSVQGAVATQTTLTHTTTATNDGVPDPTDTDDQPTPSDNSTNNVNAASSGFWGNKGKVGGTFAVVALVIVGIIAALGVFIRRRRASHNSGRDTFFDTKSPMDRVERQPSPEPSMAPSSIRNEPMDAHATPMANYGAADQYLVDTTDYSVSYPPGAAYGSTADHTNAAAQQQYYTDSQQQQYYGDNTAPQQQYYADQRDQLQPSAAAYYADSTAYDSYNQHYATADGGNEGYIVSPANHRPSPSPHPYSHPSHTSGAPPSAFGRDLARDSYQPSIDSFYGAAGTAH